MRLLCATAGLYNPPAEVLPDARLLCAVNPLRLEFLLE